MTTLTQTQAEQQIEAYLQTLFVSHLASGEMGLGIQTIALDAGWVFLYHLTRTATGERGDMLLGAPPYFIDKHTGTIHRWARNTDFWLQGRVYEALHGLTPNVPWPQIFSYSDPNKDHLTINLRPNQTLCLSNVTNDAWIRPYSERGEFVRTCIACFMAADGIGPWCWTCGIRLLDPTSTACDPCAAQRQPPPEPPDSTALRP
jgi:hypothetical protein